MPTNQFEYVDESSIDENYKCNICNEPFHAPVTTSCDHTYCQECLEHWLNEGHASCPTCRHQLSTHDIKPVTTRLVLNILDRIPVKCSQCQQSGIQRGNFTDHMSKVCPKALVNCPASDVQCPWSGPRDQLSTHLTDCNYEPLRPMLKNLLDTNDKLEKQVQSLTSQVEMMIAGGRSDLVDRLHLSLPFSANLDATSDHLRSTIADRSTDRIGNHFRSLRGFEMDQHVVHARAMGENNASIQRMEERLYQSSRLRRFQRTRKSNEDLGETIGQKYLLVDLLRRNRRMA